jgi:hypothetical protein
VFELSLGDGQPLVVVDSPPGAGKTRLVEALVATAVELGLRVAVAAPRAEQTYAIARRLASGWRSMPITLFASANRIIPTDLAAAGVNVVSQAAALAGSGRLVIANVSKFRISVDDVARAFDILVCDEAYQVSYHELYPLFAMAPQVVLVGDPGQLPPLVLTDTARYEAARIKVHWPAPRELVARFRNAPVVQMPVSRRLRQDTVDFVQPAFYRDLPFASAAIEAERAVSFAAAGIGGLVDRALDLVGNGASLVTIALPALKGPLGEVDEEAASTCAQVIARALERGISVGDSPLASGDVGVVDAHVKSGNAVRRELQSSGVAGAFVDTPEIWQGSEKSLVVARHPLSGLVTPDGFTLEPGRWCVMLSRHQSACVVVTRDGVSDALARYAHDATARASGAADSVFAGWRAHDALWRRLEQLGRVVRD